MAMDDEKVRQLEMDAMFVDFIREALLILLVGTLAVVWCWTGFVALFDAAKSSYGFTLLALTGLACFGAYQLAKEHIHFAVSLYLAGMLVAATVVFLAYGDPALLPLYLPVVLVAAPLTTPRGLWTTTAFVAVLMAVLGNAYAVPPDRLLAPLLLTLLAAATAWLSTRRLFTALAWALNMTESARRSAEEARTHRSDLQRVLHSLDIALSRLERSNRALVFAQEAAEKAYRFKSEFVANVSHELRTPLNLIVGFSEMMTTAPESYGGKPLPGAYRGDMLAIYRSSRHLLDLINDVLDLSQIEAGRMAIHKERVLLGDLIQEAVEIVRGLAEARRLQLIVAAPADPLYVDLDRVRIRQVLLNLLTNAMRYTEQGSVRVSVETDAETVTILVQDSGRGIDPDKLQRAFEAFDRMDEAQLTHGSGLGLAVSRKFVELHQGRMWIDSEPGKGTLVGVTLPLPTQGNRLPLGTVQRSQPLRQESGSPLVLLMHDDPRALSLLRRHIDGYDFVFAEDANQARALIAKESPDIILVEPGSLGQWEAVAADDIALSALPLLITPLPSVHHFGALLGASDYLPKPVTRDEVAFVLRRLHCEPQTALVIDDDPHIVRLIGRMLRSIASDVHVLEAFGGAEGLAVARTHSPDIVFVDLKMPGMSGEQFIAATKGEPHLASVPIVAVSVRSIEQESAPLHGDFMIRRGQGFVLSELLVLLETTLAGITRADAGSPANAAARLATLTG